MRYSEKHVDMRTGSLYKNILLFTVQIALSSMLQQLFNAADTAILGIFDTSSALALSGIGNVILNILFVVLFHLGVSGVAAATVLSTMFSHDVYSLF